MPEKRIHIVTRRLQWLLGSLVILLLALTLHQTLKQVTELNERDTLNIAARLRSQFQQMETVLGPCVARPRSGCAAIRNRR